MLLDGVTGSGKTEVYISLAANVLDSGGSVLYMIPEIAVSKQLGNRLKEVFGSQLASFRNVCLGKVTGCGKGQDG